MKRKFKGKAIILFEISTCDEEIREINELQDFEEIIDDDIDRTLKIIIEDHNIDFKVDSFEWEEIYD